jgi:hypothetical protein
VELVIPVLAKIPEASVLEIYAQMAAGWLRIDAAALLRDVKSDTRQAFPQRRRGIVSSGASSVPPPQPSPQGGGRVTANASPQGGGRVSKDEGYLLGLLIERPDLLPEIQDQLRELTFSSEAYQRVFVRLQEMVAADPAVIPIERLSEFPLDEQSLISAVAMTRYPELDSGSEAALRQSLDQCLQTLKINAAQRRLKTLVAEMRAAHASGDESRLVALMQENDRLARELDSLKAVRYGPS